MIYSKHLQLLPKALIQTSELRQEFKVLNYQNEQTIGWLAVVLVILKLFI